MLKKIIIISFMARIADYYTTYLATNDLSREINILFRFLNKIMPGSPWFIFITQNTIIFLFGLVFYLFLLKERRKFYDVSKKSNGLGEFIKYFFYGKYDTWLKLLNSWPRSYKPLLLTLLSAPIWLWPDNLAACISNIFFIYGIRDPSVVFIFKQPVPLIHKIVYIVSFIIFMKMLKSDGGFVSNESACGRAGKSE